MTANLTRDLLDTTKPPYQLRVHSSTTLYVQLCTVSPQLFISYSSTVQYSSACSTPININKSDAPRQDCTVLTSFVQEVPEVQ